MSHADICSAISQHQQKTIKLAGKSQYYDVVDTPELIYSSYEVNYPPYYGVIYSNLNPNQVDEKIDQVIEYYTSRRLTPIWSIHSNCKPDNLGECLEAKGFRFIGGSKAMACDLDSINYNQKKPDGLSVEYVVDNSMLRTFFDIWTDGHPFPKPLGEVMYKIISEIGFEQNDVVFFYLGYFDDEPVATSFLYMDGSSAGLWWVVTLENMRGRGIGTWMTLHRLKEAHDAGYSLGVLLATELGYPIYKKLGFKDYYSPRGYIYNPTNE